jgi:DNA anti-recombination protein RmuC
MRRVREWWKSVFSFGEAEYKGVLEMQKKVGEELAQVEKLHAELHRARAELPEALLRLQHQTQALARSAKDTEAALARLRAQLPADRAVSPAELAKLLDEAVKKKD